MGKDDTTRQTTSRFLALPATNVGRWSVRLLLVSFALLVLHTVVLLPAFERGPGFDVPRRIIVSVILLGIFSAGAAGLVGLLRQHERSWLLFLAVLISVTMAAFMLNDILGPG